MKALLLLVLLCAVGNPTAAENRKSYSRYQVLSVRPSNAAQVESLNALQNDFNLNLDFFQVPSLNRDIDILVPPQHVNRVKKSLTRMMFNPRVTVQDMERVIDAERRKMKSMTGRTLWEKYLSLTEIDNLLNSLQSQYTEHMSLFNMGNSVQGRTITGVKVSSNINGASKPAIWLECLAHAREWITTSVCLGTIEILVKNYGGSGTWGQQATAMLDKFDWYFVPVLNPDGYQYSMDSNRLWRKNRAVPRVSSCYGVDLNRNWNASHCGQGASTFECFDTYCGRGPQSEPENKALQNAVEGTSNVKAFFSIHSYSQLLLVPHAYADVKPFDYMELENIGKTAMQALRSVNGVTFQTGHGPEILYAASGGAFDYFKLNGVKYSYVYELRPATSSQGGFELPAAQIDPSIRETFASFHSFSEQIPA